MLDELILFPLGALVASLPHWCWVGWSKRDPRRAKRLERSPLGVVEHGHGFLVGLILANHLPAPTFWLGFAMPWLLHEWHDPHPWNYGWGKRWHFWGAVLLALGLLLVWVLGFEPLWIMGVN